MDTPSSFTLKLWLSLSLVNLFLQLVLTLNKQLNIRSILALVMGVINNISIIFKLFLHEFLIVGENNFPQCFAIPK